MEVGSEKYEEIGKKVAVKLYGIEGVKFGEFTLTSGKTSPYYIDLRIVPSYPDLFDNFTEMTSAIVENDIENVDRLAGVPTGGLPLGAVVAYKTEYPMFYTRKKKKSHGRKKSVEGVLEKNDNVTIVDDISTTGGSIRDAAEIIRENGANVNHAIVLVDREEGAEENLEDNGIELHSCLKVSDIVRHLRNESQITEKEHSTIQEYLDQKS